MSAVISPVQKIADVAIGTAQGFLSKIVGHTAAQVFADPLSLKTPDAAPAAAAPAAAPAAPAVDPATEAAAAAKSAAAAELLAPAKSAAATVDENKPDPAANTFAVRESMNVQRAAAAGAKKTANDVDLLGYVAPKKRSAARAILG